ncbi:MAG: ParB/Srx family N-terminal domain-containing protein [Mycobacterium sp.]
MTSRVVFAIGLTLMLAACSGTTKPASPANKADCEPPNEKYCNAVTGDLIDVTLSDLHPTQPSLGYDEVFSRVGRYSLGAARVPSPLFDAWCVANGQKGVKSAGPDAKVSDQASFTCEVPVGSETPETTAGMKTAVVGPGGKLYLTDGHHTLTSFWEASGGGPNTHLRLKLAGNLKDLAPEAFWKEMQSQGWAWLRDAEGKTISPDQVPAKLGLTNFANDRYRGVMFFLRDISYFQDDSIPPFQEFYWGYWLRNQTDPGLRLENFDLNDEASYRTLLGNIAQAMIALPEDTDIEGLTAKQLGKLNAFGQKAFDALTEPLDSPNPGKLTYSLAYKATHR